MEKVILFDFRKHVSEIGLNGIVVQFFSKFNGPQGEGLHSGTCFKGFWTLLLGEKDWLKLEEYPNQVVYVHITVF